MAELDDLLARLAPTAPLPPVAGGGLGMFPPQPPRLPTPFTNPLSTGNVDMGGLRDYLQGLQTPTQQKSQGQLPQSYSKTGSTLTGPYNQQIYPNAAAAGFGNTAPVSNLLQKIRFGRDSAPEPGPGMGGVRPDPNRLPYEEEPLHAPQETKGGRLDVAQPEKKPAGGFEDLVTPEMKQILRQMIATNPALANNPRLVGGIITKMMPFMHKRQQEKYAQARQEHTERMEELSQERAARAERLEQYKYLHDREQYVTRRMDKAWDRIKTLSDPLTEFAGDKKAELAKQQAYLKTYEDQLQSIVNDAHHAQKEVPAGRGEGVYAKGAQGKPAEPKTAAKPAEDKGPPQIFQLQADDIDAFVGKVKPALMKAKTLAEKELIIRNTFDHINKQLQADGKSPLSLPDAQKLIVRFGRDAYDPRTSGQKVNDWIADSIKSWFPDYEESDMVKGDLGFASRFYGSLLNPAEYEHMLAEGVRTAADVRPTTEQMLTDRARSGPERVLGGLEALGGALGPLGMAEAPGAMALGQSVGSAVGEQTENPWLGMLAGALAGGGAGALRGRGAAPAGGAPRAPAQPDIAGRMGQGAYSNPLQGMMGGRPFAPSTPGMGGAMPPMQNQPVPGMLRLPPPGPAGPSRGPLPGSVTGAGPSVRPKAGLYGRPPVQSEQRSIEMPPPGAEWRMGGPGEQLRLPSPEPRDPVSQAEAAAEISAGKEPAAPVEQPRAALQPGGGPYGVNQFGEHVVGDTVKLNGRTRKIEELIPARPGHMAPKAKLSGLKLPVTLTKLEPVSMAKAGKFAEGDRVKWDLPAGFGSATGIIRKVTVSPRGNAMATVERSDGRLVDVDVSSLKNV